MKSRFALSDPRLVPLALFLAWVLVCIPLLFVKVLPTVDFPNHLARSYILAHSDTMPGYLEFYQPRWAMLPNLASELILVPLAHVMPIEAAGKIFLALLFGFSIYGGARLNKALTGEWTLLGLAPALFLYNRIFAYGFINYLFGVALLPLALAIYIENKDRPAKRILMNALWMAALFIAHIDAFALYVVCAIAFDVSRLRENGGWRKPVLRDLAALCGLIAIAGIVVIKTSPTASAATAMHYNFIPKISMLLSTLKTGIGSADLLFCALVVGMIAFLFATKHIKVSKFGVPLIAGLTVAYLLAPANFKDSYYVDARIPMVLGIITLASLARVPGSSQRWAGAAIGLLLVFRVATTSASYASWQQRLDSVMADLRRVPAGSVLLVSQEGSKQFSNVDGWLPRLRHAPCLLLLEKPVMAQDLFTFPSQQPIVRATPYEKIDLPENLGKTDRGVFEKYAETAVAKSTELGISERPQYLFYIKKPGQLSLPPQFMPVVERSHYGIYRISGGHASSVAKSKPYSSTRSG